MPLTEAELTALRRRCRTVLSGHHEEGPGSELHRVGEWCEAHDAHADRYGDGAFIVGFEKKIAALLGVDAGAFMPSGTMAQQIALRVWAERAGVSRIAMHPTSHLELHEQRAYARLHGLEAILLGPRDRPTLPTDLADVRERVAAVLIELPAREIGGQLPAWEQLIELSAVARSRAIRLHMDGARLWEAREAYAPRSLAQICALFDSIYVSFYKGIGALAGAMLLGPADFIDEARLWRTRHGGTLVQLHPFVASAAMRFDAQLEKMPKYRQRALALASALVGIPGLRILPSPPQVNMFHVFFEAAPDAVIAARDRLAVEEGVWIAHRVGRPVPPGWSSLEIYVGDSLLALDDAEVVAIFVRMLAYARAENA